MNTTRASEGQVTTVNRGRSRALRTVALPVLGALVAGLAVTLAGPAHADVEPCAYRSDSGLAPGEADFDGDGQGDVAYGVPARNQGGVGGSVVVKQSTKGAVKLSRSSVGAGGSSRGDGFGTVVRAASINGDHCTDLVVSAPGAYGASGRVYIVFGAATGVGTGQATVTIKAPKAVNGDRFGAALDVRAHYESDLNSVDLAIGAPGTDVSGIVDAGMVHKYQVSGYEWSPVSVYRTWSWTQGAKGVGEAEKGDRFGEVITLVTSNYGRDVLVGVPSEDVGKAADAGLVYIRSYRGDKVSALSQKTKGVTGAPEKGDRFGATVVQSERTLAVGAPGESLGKVARAGQIQVFTQSETKDKWGTKIRGAYQARKSLTLNTAHVTGAPKKDDRVGTSLTILRGLQHSNGLTVAAGMPTRTVGKVKAAGAVALFELTPKKCPKKAAACGRVVTQSSKGFAGGTATNSRFGASLAVFGEFGPSDTGERRDTLVVGAPGGAYGATRNAGVFVQWRAASSSLVTNPTGVHVGDGFGAVAPTRWTAPSLYR